MSKEKEKIIQLRPDTTVELFEQLLQMAKKGKIKNMIFCGQNSDGEFISGSCNTTPLEEQNFISFLQLNTFKNFMQCDKETLYKK